MAKRKPATAAKTLGWRVPARAVVAPPTEIPRVHVREGFGSRDVRQHCSNLYLASAPTFINYPIVYRVRVTAELVEEPKEVLAARLLELWETTPYNHHHTGAFRALAVELGVVLNNETRASRAPKRDV